MSSVSMLAQMSWNARFFHASCDGGIVDVGVDIETASWETLIAVTRQLDDRELAHRWKTRLVVDGRPPRELWYGSDWWIVEHGLYDNLPKGETLALPDRFAASAVATLDLELQLFGEAVEPIERRSWSATATVPRDGTLEIELQEVQALHGIPFELPPAPTVVIAEDELAGWIAKLAADEGPDSERVHYGGSVRRDASTGRLATAEGIASEVLGAPCGVVAVYAGPICELQSIVNGALFAPRIAFVRDGVFVQDDNGGWLATPGSPVASRVIAAPR